MKSAFVFFLAAVAVGAGISTWMFVLPYWMSDAADPESDSNPAANGVVSWATLAHVGHRTVNGHVEHYFSRTVSALDNRTVKLRGFLIPLDHGERHSHFLLSASPRTCFECWAPGPEGWVDVTAEVPVEDTYGQILVSGRFLVLGEGWEDLYYRMVDAARVAL